MKTLFRILGTAAAVAVTGAAIVALDKLLNEKDPLHVESVEFPEDAELDAKEAAKAAEEVMRGMSVREADDGVVSFYAFKDDDRYKDDIVVGLNGKVYRIQRGKHVRIPREVYNIIRRSMAQDAATAEMLEQKSREYEAVKAQLN